MMEFSIQGIIFDEYSVRSPLLDEGDLFIIPEVSFADEALSVDSLLRSLPASIGEGVYRGEWLCFARGSLVTSASAAIRVEYTNDLAGMFVLADLIRNRLIYQTDMNYRLFVGDEDFIRSIFSSVEFAREKFHTDVHNFLLESSFCANRIENLEVLGDLAVAFAQTHLP